MTKQLEQIMIRIIVRADINTVIDSPEQYQAFCEDIEDQHTAADVLSAEIGGEARIKLAVKEEEYIEDDYRSKFTDLDFIEDIKLIERLAE